MFAGCVFGTPDLHVHTFTIEDKKVPSGTEQGTKCLQNTAREKHKTETNNVDPVKSNICWNGLPQNSYIYNTNTQIYTNNLQLSATYYFSLLGT
jgi:hypothetical protein